MISQIWQHYSSILRGAPFWHLLILQSAANFLALCSSFPGLMFLKKKNLKPHLASQMTACVIYRSNRLDWPSYKWERYITAGDPNWSESLCQASTGFWNTTYDFQQCYYLFFSQQSKRSNMPTHSPTVHWRDTPASLLQPEMSSSFQQSYFQSLFTSSFKSRLSNFAA